MWERHLRLQLHGTIYRSDSFVLMLCYCANLKAVKYESTTLNRIVADKIASCNCSLRYQSPHKNELDENSFSLLIQACNLSKYPEVESQGGTS